LVDEEIETANPPKGGDAKPGALSRQGKVVRLPKLRVFHCVDLGCYAFVSSIYWGESVEGSLFFLPAEDLLVDWFAPFPPVNV